MRARFSELCWMPCLIAATLIFFAPVGASAQETPTESAAEIPAEETPAETDEAEPRQSEMDVRSLFRAGGAIGMIIIALSVAMVALIVEHLLSIRRSALMPRGLAEEVHRLILQGQFREAEEVCQ